MKKSVIFFSVLFLISLGIAITANAINGSTISDVSIRPLTIYYETFNGSTTEFSNYTFEELQDLSGTVLEKSDYGKIEFLENLNFSLVGGEDAIVDFDSYFNISDNLIYANPTYLPYMDKSAEMEIHGLSYEDPVVVNGVDECTTCNIINYSGGTLTFNTTLFEGPFYVRNASDFVEEPVCGNGVVEEGEECDDGNTENGDGCSSSCLIEDDDGGDTGGGGGGGGDPGETPIEDGEDQVEEDIISVEPEFLVVKMNKGEYYRERIKILNNGTRDLNVSIFMVGEISDYIFPEKRRVSVGEDSIEEIYYDIYFSRSVPADVYTGKVIFSGGNARFEQEVILDVRSEDALFDIKAEVLKRYLFPGARARANVSIINMGDLRNFDVEFEYKIIDYEKNVYSSKKEFFAMNRTYSNIFFLDLPEDIEIGDYLFYGKVVYPPTNISASAYDTITVENVSFWTWILLILILILIGIYVYYRYRKYSSGARTIKKVQKDQEKSTFKKSSPVEKEVPKLPDEFD